ncbi:MULTISPECIES: MobF family relaxase [Roseicella]|uniref:MobF family relaxase n=1 Tax=Roseicella TaxID=2730923 RepID=UPI00104DD7A4|nr:MobF family relaxase [Roseicella aquatilis]
MANLARYYTKGTDTPEQRDIAELAEQVATGDLTYSEALNELMRRDGDRGGDYGMETEQRLGQALAKAASRTQDGDMGEAAAQPRRDMHPLVAKGLGIDPEQPLTRQQINALLVGLRTDGEVIEGKHYSTLREYTDPKTGETKEKIPLGSVDFTLTPDKSVSVAWAFAVPAEQAAIYQAHRDAASEAMAYLEAHIAQAKLGHGGKDGSEPGHIGWIEFDHYTARPTLWMEQNGQTERVAVPIAGDPDLHTHFTVMNAVFCESGRVGSLDLGQLDGLIKETGALYQAHLATNLRDRLQASVSLDPDTGMARLDAIPTEVRDHFSKRSQSGENAARAYAASLGLVWDELTPERRTGLLKAGTQGEIPGIDGETRERLKKDDMADFADWHRQADALNWQYRGIETYGPSPPPLSPEERLQKAYETALPWMEAELDKRAVITAPDARTAALRGLIAHGIDTTVDIDRVTERFMEQGVRQQGQRTRLYWQEHDNPRQAKLTTALHVHQEKAFIELATAAAADRTGRLSASEIEHAIQQSGLTFEKAHGRAQRDAIHRLGEGGRIAVLIGAAGMGKTTSLKPLVSAWNARQQDVHGIALAWRQADDLIDAGISRDRTKAYSVFVEAVAKGDVALSRQSVVVVDELSLLGTRQGLELLELQQKHGFRLVMLGDDRQCQSIEAGPVIDLARRALGPDQVPEILTTLRQKSKEEKEIVRLFREGKAAEALALKRADGTAELVPGGQREALARVAALAGERLRANADDERYSLTVSAPTNADAHRLGVAIREERRRLGQIGPDAVKIRAIGNGKETYDMALAAGDKVRLFASTRAEGERGSIGRNGSVLTVLAADAKGMQVRNAKGREGRITWKTLNDGSGRVRLAYGEVMTTHTAQGSTATEHIYAIPSGSKTINGFSAYSSGTRHRRTSFLVVSEGAERSEIAKLRPMNDMRPITKDNAWENVARNFSRQPKKDLAIDFLAKAGAVRKGTARSLQQGLRPAEIRAAKGEPAMMLSQNFAQRNQAEALAPIVAALERTASRQQAVIERVKRLPSAVTYAVQQKLERLRGPVRERGQGQRIGR